MRTVVLLLIGFVLAGCSVSVKETYDHELDFSRYKTYCWMAGCAVDIAGPAFLDDRIASENIRQAIEAELGRKGLVRTTDNPDLLIGVTITVKDEQAIVYHRAEDSPFFIKPLDLDKEVINYQKGSLIIGMADARESRMVWQSHVSAYLESTPDLSEANIRKGIRHALRNYPPTKK